MSTVDYSLLLLNRKVHVTYGDMSTVMLFRDLRKVISDSGGELLRQNYAIVTSKGKILDIQIEEMESFIE